MWKQPAVRWRCCQSLSSRCGQTHLPQKLKSYSEGHVVFRCFLTSVRSDSRLILLLPADIRWILLKKERRMLFSPSNTLSVYLQTEIINNPTLKALSATHSQYTYHHMGSVWLRVPEVFSSFYQKCVKIGANGTGAVWDDLAPEMWMTPSVLEISLR